MKLSVLRPQIDVFAQTLLASLGASALAVEVIKPRPLTLRLGMQIAGIPPADLLAFIKAADKRAAVLAAWPHNTTVIIDNKSEVESADGTSVLLDLVLPSIQLTPELS